MTRPTGSRMSGVLCRTLHRPGVAGCGLLALLSRLLAVSRRLPLTRHRRRALRESANKLHVLRCFEDPMAVLGHRGPDDDSLAEPIAAAYRDRPEDAVWITEGLACLFADRRAPASGAATDRTFLAELPPPALVPAHAGLGLSIAWRHLRGLTAQRSSDAARTCLERIVEAAEASSRAGYVETTLESLGFAARLLAPAQVPRLARHLATVDPRLPRCFWHGLGRALYFTPASFLPGADSVGRAIRLVRREVPPGPARDSVLEGLTWPLLLVNLPTPEVVAGALARHPELADSGPVCRGLEAAIEVWAGAAASPAALVELQRFEPATARSRWIRLVREPCQRVLATAEGPVATGEAPARLEASRETELEVAP